MGNLHRSLCLRGTSLARGLRWTGLRSEAPGAELVALPPETGASTFTRFALVVEESVIVDDDGLRLEGLDGVFDVVDEVQQATDETAAASIGAVAVKSYQYPSDPVGVVQGAGAPREHFVQFLGPGFDHLKEPPATGAAWWRGSFTRKQGYELAPPDTAMIVRTTLIVR